MVARIGSLTVDSFRHPRLVRRVGPVTAGPAGAGLELHENAVRGRCVVS